MGTDLLRCVGIIAVAHAQLGHDGENAAKNGGGGGDGNANGFFGLRPGPGMSLKTAIHYRTIHGILAATSIAILFPVGSILMRVIPGRAAIWVHAIFQLLATALFIAAAGIGLYLVKNVNTARDGSTSSLVSPQPPSRMAPMATLPRA